MNAEPDKLRELFLAALKVPGEGRAAFLHEACAEAEDLRERVQMLIQAHEELGSIAPPGQTAAGTTQDLPPTPEQPGAVIKNYKLIELIGEGGMGTVWMAQQTAPVKRLVALKLIKAGMDSKQVIARFEAERQALALMDHPNIAKVFDGGMTPPPLPSPIKGEGGTGPLHKGEGEIGPLPPGGGGLGWGGGRPYFVMELVKGQPITKYCDEHHLTPRQRLELFVPVCQAVQHAHQKGIIHRDLKPSNVLVASYDGKPVPKVIDFGVAKATGVQLTDATLVTGFGAIVGTLEYMSPEQAEINQLDIDTRSDIYSLGVLLYELLAGSPPFSRKDLEKAGMLEMLRVIREQEPSKPSTKLSSSDALPTLSANRGTEPAKLTKLVRGELDWIVMKALEKDRGRRYETANGFAMDVQRYLADEAVQACPPSRVYRMRKFIQRNQTAVVAAALVALALAAGLVGTTWGLVRADEERDKAVAQQMRADEEAANAIALAEFLNEDLLFAIDPDVRDYSEVRLQELVEAASQRLPGRLKDRPLAEAHVCSTFRSAFKRMGDFSNARKYGERSVAIRLQQLGQDADYTITATTELAVIYREQGLLANAAELLEKQVVVSRRSKGVNHPTTLGLLVRLGHVDVLQGRHGRAEASLREVLAFGDSPWNPQGELAATARVCLAVSLRMRGRFPEAETVNREACTLRQASLGSDDGEVAGALAELGMTLLGQGKNAEAEEAFRNALRIREIKLSAHWRCAYTRCMLGASLLGQGKHAEAEQLLLEGYRGLAERERLIPVDCQGFVVQALREIVKLFEATNRRDEAIKWRAELEARSGATKR